MQQEQLHFNNNSNEPLSPGNGVLKANLISKKEWIPDDSAVNCTNCRKEFKFLFRKHHCRICGQVYCKNCSTSKLLEFQNEKKNMRVCNKCDSMHSQFQKDLNLHKPLFHKEEIPEKQKGISKIENKNGSQQPQYEIKHYGDETLISENFSAYISKQSMKQENELIQKINDFGRESVRISSYMKELNSEMKSKNRAAKDMSDYQKSVVDSLEKYFEMHVKQITESVLEELKIDKETWTDILNDFSLKAVKNILPSSRLLNDSIDINKFIKIFILDWKNQDKCQYVNGIVFCKNVAHKRMQTKIEVPKILLITNSLGYIREEEGFMDIESVIRQEEPYVQIILSKIKKVHPDIIIVEKDVSRLALDTLMANNKTVITNVKSSIIRRIARLTQTISCPSTNLIDENFVPGECDKFYVEKIIDRKKASTSLVTNETSLIYLDGCEPYLGCTIILSGPQLEELKMAKKALKKILLISRMVLLEKEYLQFIQCWIEPNKTPFLVDKHLERNQLVLQLIMYSKKNINDETGIDIKESSLKKSLNLMCQQPQKMIINFYDPTQDVSLGNKIKEMVRACVQECTKCKELKINHITSFYHKNGYVELKLRAENHLKNDINSLDYELKQASDIYIFAQCNNSECKKIVLPSTKLNSQIYEMSFFKFLEQFFYNTELRVLIKDSECNHQAHMNFSFIFKMGPIKVIVTYSKEHVYKLDLQNFKELKGKSVARNQTYILEQKDYLFSNFTAANQYVEDQLKQLRRKAKTLVQSNPNTIPVQNKDYHVALIAFLKSIKKENQTFKQQMLNSFPDLIIKSILQLNRIHKNVIIHLSHYLSIIKETCNIILYEINRSQATQKQILQTSNSSNQTSNNEQRTQSLFIEDFLLNNYPKPQNSSKYQNTSSQIEYQGKKGKDQSNGVISDNAGITPNCFDNLPQFEFKFIENQYLKELFIDTPSLPLGCNKNCIQVNSKDFGTMLAFSLSSNLYIEGLIKINYLNLSSKLSYSKNQEKQQLGEQDLFKNNQKIHISDNDDVFNKNASNIDIENELLCGDNYTFSFSFSNYGPPENFYLKIKRQGGGAPLEIKSEKKVVFDEEQFDQFKQVESDFPSSFIEEFNQIKKEIIGNKSQYKSPQRNQTQKVVDQFRNIETSELQKSDVYDIHNMFQDKMDFSVKVYFPAQFEALRKLYCGSYDDFIHSIFQSEFWADNTGGKSKSKFFKSADEKYIFKLVKIGELKMFRDMGLAYFEYLSKSFYHYCPSALARILGAYKIKMKRSNANGKSSRFCLFLMENILLGINDNNCAKYDLKGSKKKRFIINKHKGQVLLDNNFLQDFNAKPIPMQYIMKSLQQIAINNDAFFLSKNNIVDYSMLAIIDKERRLVRIGIIDYVQQYTIDKILESRFKKVINAGEKPTIIDPEQYKKRFKDAIDMYFIAIYEDKSIQSLATYLKEIQ